MKPLSGGHPHRLTYEHRIVCVVFVGVGTACAICKSEQEATAFCSGLALGFMLTSVPHERAAIGVLPNEIDSLREKSPALAEAMIAGALETIASNDEALMNVEN